LNVPSLLLERIAKFPAEVQKSIGGISIRLNQEIALSNRNIEDSSQGTTNNGTAVYKTQCLKGVDRVLDGSSQEKGV
jgi:hypothetical protein